MIKDKSESTILEYLDNVRDSFSKTPFHEIDALILSQMSYLNLENLVPLIGDNSPSIPISSLYKSEEFDGMVKDTLTPSLNIELIRKICASPRYREVTLHNYSNKYSELSEEQFSAVTFTLTTGENVVAFRGTDLTITGWKEDFNMFFLSPVPSQISAVSYLEEVSTKITGDIFITGHSKGGNLAVYSSAFSKKELQSRIIKVYSLDGPDFPKDIMENSDYLCMEKKVLKVVPEGSLIGIMFENTTKPKIIKSSNFSFLQHDPFSWKCQETTFEESEEFSNNIQHLDKTINTLIYELDVSKRKLLVDTLFEIISSTKIHSLNDISISIVKEKDSIKKALKEVDEETGKCIKEMLKKLAKISFEIQKDRIDEIKTSSILSKILP